MSNLTKAGAIRLAESGWWRSKTPREVVAFQLYEDRLCMDFGDFQQATEAALGRSVWTHEFARPDLLRAEFDGTMPKPDFEEIMARIPPWAQTVIIDAAAQDGRAG